MTDARPAAEDSQPRSEWTRAERIAWCRQRAAQEPWTIRIGSVIQDMAVMDIPLTLGQQMAGMKAAMDDGEQGVQTWIDGIR